MKTFYRKEKIIIFLKDYYFGFSKWIIFLRLFGGPLLILIGLYLYNEGFDKFSVAYSGFCILYGIYMIFKPCIWVLSHTDNYKTENVDIEVEDDFLRIKDAQNESKIGFETFIKILEKKDYFSFVITKSQRLRIPKRLLEVDEQKKIRNKI